MQALLGQLRQSRRIDRLTHRRPTMLVGDGELLHDRMRSCHVVEDEDKAAG